MSPSTVCLIGGTGFVGRHLATELARRGHTLKLLTRRRERHREFLVFPRVNVVQADVHNVAALSSAIEGSDVVISMAGILNPEGKDNFTRVHCDLPATIAAACATQEIGRIVHISSLGTREDAPSEYLRSKWAGEQALMRNTTSPTATTILRPSVIFGLGDSFFNRFATLLRMSPGIFPLAAANARMQPIYIGDVVEAVVTCLEERATWGECYDIAGPYSYSLQELVEYTAQIIGERTWVFPLPASLALLQAKVMERLPGKPFTVDNLRSLSVDNVTEHNGLDALGIAPTSIDAVVPRYLGRENRNRRNRIFRRTAGR